MKDVAQLNNPGYFERPGYWTQIATPWPYGERLESEPALTALHSLLGLDNESQFGGWNLSVSGIAGAAELLPAAACRQQFKKPRTASLDCVQKNYIAPRRAKAASRAMLAEDFANRLRKNLC